MASLHVSHSSALDKARDRTTWGGVPDDVRFDNSSGEMCNDEIRWARAHRPDTSHLAPQFNTIWHTSRPARPAQCTTHDRSQTTYCTRQETTRHDTRHTTLHYRARHTQATAQVTLISLLHKCHTYPAVADAVAPHIFSARRSRANSTRPSPGLVQYGRPARMVDRTTAVEPSI